MEHGQEPPADQTPADESDPIDEEQPDALDADALRQQLAKVRREAAKYRTRAKELEPLANRAKELEDQGKSDAERLTERLTAAEQRAAEAEARAIRLEVATERGLTPAQAKFLTGTDREQVEAMADEILAAFRTEAQTPAAPGRPVERLTPGAVPSAAEPEPDYEAIADKVRRW